MPRNGSGVYNLPAPTPVPNTTADANSVASNIIDVAAEITNSLAKDGQTLPTANLPMAGFRHTNVADGAAEDEYLTVRQAQTDAVHLVSTVGGTADAITLTVTPGPSSLVEGLRVLFKAASTNTGAVTIDLNGLGARNVKAVGATLNASDIRAGTYYEVMYDGTDWQISALNAPLKNQFVEVETTNLAAWALSSMAHTFGERPRSIEAYLVHNSATADNGYAQGDLVPFGAVAANVPSVTANTSFIYVKMQASAPQIVSKTSDALFTINTSLWKIVVKAWRYDRT